MMISAIGAPLNRATAESHVLTPAEATSLRGALAADAADYHFSSCVTLLDGVRGFDAGFYTWATVKCYYSAFYSLRALLALDNQCIFHIGSSPYAVVAQSGALPARRGGRTHEAVLNLFSETSPSHFLLSQNIGGRSPLAWIKSNRISCNYSEPRFCEPDVPDRFRGTEKLGSRQALTAYMAKGWELYVFDDGHGMLAFPLACLRFAGKAIAASPSGKAVLDDDDSRFLRAKCRDRSGVVKALVDLISEGLEL